MRQHRSMTIAARLQVSNSVVLLREAQRDDVAAIVDLLLDDPLGVRRESADGDDGLRAYLDAFDAIKRDPAHLLLVVVDGSEVVATMQLSFIPGLTRRGALRAQIEGVRVQANQRGRGLGQALFGWAIEESRRRGCALVQLSTDKSRAQARWFYERLGFIASHEGLKLDL